MYNDIWPTGTWSVVDYYLDKKPAYYAMKRSFVPQMLALLRVGDDYFLCCVNDRQQTLKRTVQVSTHRYDGTLLQQTSIVLTVAGGGRLMQKLPRCYGEGDYLLAVAQTEGQPTLRDVYHLGRYREERLEPRYSVTVEPTEDGVLVHIQAHSFVPCIKLYSGEGAVYDDNFFDMAAGEQRTVRITGCSRSPEVVTFVDTWEH